MSQADKRDPEKGNVIDEQNDQRLPGLIQPEKRENVGDSSDPLFAMYSNFAEDEDKKMTDRWKKDADGIIIFTGLFSAVVATLVAVSLQDLRPNSQDRAAFYLEKLYELQADPNVPRPSTPSAVATPPPFSPPRYAIWVNSLWFLSLVISLSCAMLATSLQQWARRYLTITQPARCSPHKRARTRAFFASGVEKFHVPWAVDALPAMVHLSLFIFFAGLLVYLFNINHTVFKVVICWVTLLTTVYGLITFMPIVRPDSPYYSPLSSTAWFLLGIIPYAVLKVPQVIVRPFSRQFSFSIYLLRDRCHNWVFGGLQAVAEAASSKRQSEVDAGILDWTANALDEDGTLERFLETIPGFYKSDMVKDIPEWVAWSILGQLRAFIVRTLSSNSVSGSVKTRRLAICFNASTSVAPDSIMLRLMFQPLVYLNWSGPESVEIGYFLRSWDQSSQGQLTPFIRGIITLIVACEQEGNDRWTGLALDHLGIQESVLQDYLAQGDSLLLANLIHFTRHANHSEFFAAIVLANLPQFDTHNTLPDLQHDFCAVWNEVVREAQNHGTRSGFLSILREIRHHYIALH